jgi:hypothetical protein
MQISGETEVLGEKHYTALVVDEWMSMEHWWNDTDRPRPKHSDSNLSQCHSVHDSVDCYSLNARNITLQWRMSLLSSFAFIVSCSSFLLFCLITVSNYRLDCNTTDSVPFLWIQSWTPPYSGHSTVWRRVCGSCQTDEYTSNIFYSCFWQVGMIFIVNTVYPKAGWTHFAET